MKKERKVILPVRTQEMRKRIQIRTRRPRSLTAIASIAAIVMLASNAFADEASSNSAPDAGRVFEPPAFRPETYGIQEPQEEPELQRRYVTSSADGTQLWVETWLPEHLDSGQPVTGVPTIMTVTPYAKKGSPPNTSFDLMERVVPRGYAYTVVHSRGTAESGGCVNEVGELDARDALDAIDYVTSTSWSDGTVGLMGLSTPAGTAVSVAGRYAGELDGVLKAIVVGAPWWPVAGYDGVVPYVNISGLPAHAEYGINPYSASSDIVSYGETPEDLVAARLSEGGIPPPDKVVQRPGCTADYAAPSTNLDNSVIPYYFEREVRRWARDIKAATFMFHGFGDGIVPPTYQSGLFDRIDAPKTGLFGWWWHETPAPEDRYTAIGADWARPDFYPMVLAWFDHHLMGIDNGVEGWPVAQVQDNTGQWRAEANWPATDGSQGQLLLGDGGLLGDLVPQDGARSSYTEEIVPFDRDSELNDRGTEVLFTTEPLTDPLHITGRPVLDLWMILDKPDAHVAVELETFDADGNPLDAPFSAGNGVVFGARSMQHNDAFVDGLFLQDTARPAPMGSPFQTQIRLDTVDLVIPEGGFMRLRIAGSARWGPGLEPPEAPTIFQHPTVTSGSATNVTILHDCNFISTLRFEMPSKHPDFLNVREVDEEGAALTPAPVHGRPQTTDGGIATDRVCGKQRGGPDGSFGAEIKSAR